MQIRMCVYGPPCSLQFLRLVLPLFVTPRGNGAGAGAKCVRENFCNETFTSRGWTRATSRNREYCAVVLLDFLKVPSLYPYNTDPSSIIFITPYFKKFSETLAVENNIHNLLVKNVFCFKLKKFLSCIIYSFILVRL